MPQEILNIFLAALGTLLTGLVSLLIAKLSQLISSKVSDKKAAKYLETVARLALTAVQEVYQTYVEAIKKEGKFDKEAQEKALALCLAKIKTKLAPDLIDFITKNFGDLDDYLKSLIESNIYMLKN